MQQSSKILRPKAGVRVLCLFIYLAGLVLLPLRMPGRFGVVVAAGYAVVGAFWLADIFLKRVVLQPNGILIFAAFRSHTYPRSEIESVKWESGCGASMKLRDGNWIRLPNTGQTPQGLTNSIRAWLKKTETDK